MFDRFPQGPLGSAWQLAIQLLACAALVGFSLAGLGRPSMLMLGVLYAWVGYSVMDYYRFKRELEADEERRMRELSEATAQMESLMEAIRSPRQPRI